MSAHTQTHAPRATRAPREGYRINWWLTGLIAICSLTVLVPLYIAVVTSLKTQGQITSGVGLELPNPIHLQNFVDAWTVTDFPVKLFNSAFVTTLSVVLGLAIASVASYAIARNLHRRTFRIIYYVVLSALFVPFPIVMLPLVKQTSSMGLDNLLGLVLLYAAFQLAFNVFLYVSFIRSIPIELEEAARMDGASTFKVFWRVIFPLLAPMNATLGILMFLYVWNDFLLPLVILSDPSQQTLPLAQYAFQSQTLVSYGPAFASYLMAMTPVIIIYIFSQRWVLSGIMRGSVK